MLPRTSTAASSGENPAGIEPVWRRDLDMVLRRYGFLGLDADRGYAPVTTRLRLSRPTPDPGAVTPSVFTAVFADSLEIAEALPGIEARSEPVGELLYAPRRPWLHRRIPIYRTVLGCVSFSGSGITPIWATQSGRAVLGWWQRGSSRYLLVGLDVAEEIVRYTQGDPDKVASCTDKTLWGSGHERPAFLYEDHILAGYELIPWADRLGFTLARLLAAGSGLPLVSPLPGGARGGILLTGDDDQAWLEKYDEQLQLLDGFPITYLMLPHTRHSPESLARMPTSVEFGVHVDALDASDRYASICEAQTQAVRQLTGRPARCVRNHGHLNSGHWGHLAAWERSGLAFDLNIRGLDGTCPTGSYLPFEVRRPDGSWSPHISLFSTFSDSMLYLQKWPEGQQIRCITALADQIECADPGVVVLNFHPQNVSDVSAVHRAVMALGQRPGWVALGAESYLDWLLAIRSLRLVEEQGRIELHAPHVIDRLALSWPATGQDRVEVLPAWNGACEVSGAVRCW